MFALEDLYFGGDSVFVSATLTSSGRRSPTMAQTGRCAHLSSGFYFQLSRNGRRQKVAMAPTSTSRCELGARQDGITGLCWKAEILRLSAQEWLQDKTAGQGHRRPSLLPLPCKMRTPATAAAACPWQRPSTSSHEPESSMSVCDHYHNTPLILRMQPLALAGCMRCSPWNTLRHSCLPDAGFLLKYKCNCVCMVSKV